MERRFGFKDLMLAILLVVLIVSVWLSMKQDDLQSEKLERISRSLNDQAGDLKKIARALERGVPTAGSNGGGATTRPASTGPVGAAFARVQAVQSMPGYAQGDWLVDVFGVAVGKLTPLISTDMYQSAVEGFVIESLATRDPETMEWQPFIAESWESEDLSKDWQAYVDTRMKVPLTEDEARREPGLPHADVKADALSDKQKEAQAAYVAKRVKEGRRPSDIGKEDACPPAERLRFRIRPGVTFSDESPLTAHDVVYTYQLIMNPEIAAPRLRAYYDKIKSVKADGDFVVTFELNEPYFMSFNFCGGLGIMSKKFYSQFTPAQINHDPGLLFGSGPYRLAQDPREWKPSGAPIELVRNDHYWAGFSPAFDKLVFRVITDDVARLTTFRNGDIDRFRPTPEQYQSVKKDAELLKKKQLFEYETTAGGYRYIAWNQERDGKPTFFADKRVRRALTMLTNREKMCRELMVGLATPASGPFHRLGDQDDASITPWPYDPAAARALLKEAGFEDRNGDGTIEDPQGKPFKLKLIYPATSTNYQQMAFALKDDYARAGIELEPDPLEWTIMIQRIDQRQFDAMTLGWGGAFESDPYQMFHSTQVGDGGDNYIHYINPACDRAIEQARTTLDKEKRTKLWHEVHRILHEDQPYTFLWTSRAVAMNDVRIRNVKVVKSGLSPEVEWFVPEAVQKWGR